MICPGTSDWQSHGTRLQNAIDNVSVFAKEGRRYGAIGMLNTEWGDTGHRNTLGINMHGYAHGAAHSWNGKAVNDLGFTQTFCRHFFGQKDGQLAKAIKALGNTETLVGEGTPYHSLSEAIDPKIYLHKGVNKNGPAWVDPNNIPNHIDPPDSSKCRKVVTDLGSPLDWMQFAKGMDQFAKQSLEDIILGARMDSLACKRILMAKAIRSGKEISSKELRSLTAEFKSMAREFEKNWLRRNRPSRLSDNTKIFTNAIKEMEKLANK